MAVSGDFALQSVKVAMTPWERFDEFLQARGKRITKQRRLIVEQVYASHDHFDAEQLIDLIHATPEGAKASRATVYRTLGDMVDAGLLRKMVLGGREVYEHDYGYPQHDHLFCSACQSLIEFSSDDLVRIREAVAASHQFRAESHRLIITGICLDCRTARSKNRHQDRV